MNDPIQNTLDRLDGVKQTGPQQWQAKCPAHDDRVASLSIGRGADGRALLDCKAGCPTLEVLQALGLKLSDLYATQPAGRSQTAEKQIVATYDYCDTTGELLFQVVRFEPKDFRQRRPDGNGGWTWKLGDVRRVLYRLPELLTANAGDWVFVAEGEKDVDNLFALGLVATTNAGGAGKWARLSDDTALHGRRVAIIHDNDAPGRSHAQDVAGWLHGKAAAVRIIDLSTISGFVGKDVSDWIDWLDGKTAEELAAALMNMADVAPLWTPTAAEPRNDATAPTPVNSDPERGVIVRLSDVAPQPVQWLHPARIARGKVTVIAGNPGLGKSFITLDYAARVSTGNGWPDYPASFSEPGGVVLLSAEDDLADTIRPRLDAAGANVSRIVALTTIKRFDPKCQREVFESFNLSDHLPILESAIGQVGNCKLVIIDPISAYLGGADSHNNAEVRSLLAPLSELAARHRVAVIAVSHLNKGTGEALNRVMGSLAFVAAARAAYVVTKDRDNPSRRLFLPAKNNLGIDDTGLAYQLGGGSIPHVEWERYPVRISADDAVSPNERQRGPAPEEREEAEAWLQNMLAGGPQPAEHLFAEAKKVGITHGTLRRAKAVVGVTMTKDGFQGPWLWSLPDAEIKQEPDAPKGAPKDAQLPLPQTT